MLRDEILQYTQPNGLVSERTINPANDTTGNGLLNLSLYYVALWNRREVLYTDREAFNRVVRSCACSSLFPVPLNRSPTKLGDQNGWDDYIGVATASVLLGSDLAHQIYAYGKQSHMVFNNVDMGEFSFKAWFGRNLGVASHLILCGGRDLSLLENLALRASIRFRSSDASSQILAWLMNTAMVYRGLRSDSFDIKEALSQYLHPEHPIVRYWV